MAKVERESVIIKFRVHSDAKMINIIKVGREKLYDKSWKREKYAVTGRRV